jgi:hypothetical protein
MPSPMMLVSTRAGNGTRTRDPNLGKVVLYQLSYSRTPARYRSAHNLRPRLGDDHVALKHLLTTGPVEVRGIEPLTS